MLIALLRTILLYLFLMAGVRLMGKRQVGELEPSELVLAMLLSDLAAVPMQDFGTPLLSGLLPMITLLCLTMLLSVATMKSIRFRRLVCGSPTVVLQNGKLLPKAMNKVRLTVDELCQELRLQGVTDLSQVQCAILETSGQLSVLRYQAQQPPTAETLGLVPPEPGLPVILINDGRVLEEQLQALGHDRQWLSQLLHEKGLHGPEEAFLLSVDRLGKLYLIQKEETQL